MQVCLSLLFVKKGYCNKQEYNKMMLGIILVGFTLLFVVYAGLAYLGAQGVNYYSLDVNAYIFTH